MKKIASIILLAVFISNTAHAESSSSVGINFAFDVAFGTQYEFDISKAANNKPVAIQLFFKSYQQKLGGGNTWNSTAVGAAGIYDFTTAAKFDKNVHPYAGLGLVSVAHSWAGIGSAPNYTGADGGIYITGGVRYNLNPQIDADLNLNNVGGLTVGANFKF
jgi:hypothetical protein